MFNSLYSLDAVEGATVLDLFAGTGALGIEALSRGADHAVFVERDRDAVEALRANLEATRLADRATVAVSDVDRYLAAAGRAGTRFALALVDPPYDYDDWADLLPRLPADLVVIESDRELDMPDSWVVHRSKRYGSTVVTLTSTAHAGPEPAGS